MKRIKIQNVSDKSKESGKDTTKNRTKNVDSTEKLNFEQALLIPEMSFPSRESYDIRVTIHFI